MMRLKRACLKRSYHKHFAHVQPRDPSFSHSGRPVSVAVARTPSFVDALARAHTHTHTRTHTSCPVCVFHEHVPRVVCRLIQTLATCAGTRKSVHRHQPQVLRINVPFRQRVVRVVSSATFGIGQCRSRVRGQGRPRPSEKKASSELLHGRGTT